MKNPSILEVMAAAETVEDVEELERKTGVETREIPRRRETNFILSDLVLREYYNKGFISVITFGRQRSGKSIYNIKVVAEVYGALNRRLTWKQLIDRYVVFSLNDLIDRLRGTKSILPALVWDDAGVHGSTYLYFIDKKKVMLLSALFQTAGVKISALLMNTPNPEFLLKHLRSVDSILTLVVKVDKLWSAAYGYRLKILPSGAVRVKRIFIDQFKRELPAYQYYYNKRKMYTEYVLNEISRLIDEEPRNKEEKIAELLRKGYTYRQISEFLHVSHSTISQVKKKLQAGGTHV